MKKIDLHLHTVKSVSDYDFQFSLEKLKKYICEREIDAIAITNHNLFNREQYESIRQSLDIPVFPGVEIDLEKGHLLIITAQDDVYDFEEKCKKVSKEIVTENDTLTFDKFDSIFTNRDKYILIPHYQKNPVLKSELYSKIGNIYTGEVKNQNKFSLCKKNEDGLVPVLFSDERIDEDLTDFSLRQTYIDVQDVTFNSLKYALKDKNKVALSKDGGNDLFEVLPNGFLASTGLNVVLGNRSSGKSITLNKINHYFSNVKYIKQFSLIEKEEENESKIFSNRIQTNKSLLIDNYLNDFKNVLVDVLPIDIEKKETELKQYLDSWINYATEYNKRDSFAKAKIYSEGLLENLDDKEIQALINSLNSLLSSVKYKNLINKYLDNESIIGLMVELIHIHDDIHLKNKMIKEANNIIRVIKDNLTTQSTITQPLSFDFKDYYLSKKKIEIFNFLFDSIKEPTEILNEQINKFTIVAKTKPFSALTEYKAVSGKKISFRDAFANYNDGYSYINFLKRMDSLSESEIYKYIVSFDYKILNEYGLEVSGGERSEFRLLEELNGVTQFDMLLIDEPESSFDNVFLNKDVNTRIKGISKQIPVFLVTHNSSVGESIKPDYYLYTKRDIDENGNLSFLLFGGYPTAKELMSIEGKTIDNYASLITSLEGGDDVFSERKKDYEILKNR